MSPSQQPPAEATIITKKKRSSCKRVPRNLEEEKDLVDCLVNLARAHRNIIIIDDNPVPSSPAHVDDVQVQEHVIPSSSSTRRHICGYCNRSFSSGQALGGHVTSHTSTKTLKKETLILAGDDDHKLEEEHKCSECGKVFQTGQALGGHMSSHNTTKTMKKPTAADHKKLEEHKCSVCGKVFGSGQSLGGHKRTHYDRFWDGQYPPTKKSRKTKGDDDALVLQESVVVEAPSSCTTTEGADTDAVVVPEAVVEAPTSCTTTEGADTDAVVVPEAVMEGPTSCTTTEGADTDAVVVPEAVMEGPTSCTTTEGADTDAVVVPEAVMEAPKSCTATDTDVVVVVPEAAVVVRDFDLNLPAPEYLLCHDETELSLFL